MMDSNTENKNSPCVHLINLANCDHLLMVWCISLTTTRIFFTQLAKTGITGTHLDLCRFVSLERIVIIMVQTWWATTGLSHHDVWNLLAPTDQEQNMFEKGWQLVNFCVTFYWRVRSLTEMANNGETRNKYCKRRVPWASSLCNLLSNMITDGTPRSTHFNTCISPKWWRWWMQLVNWHSLFGVQLSP